MSERSELIDAANELGLDFKKNISSAKLQAMISAENGEPIPVDEVAPPSPAMKAVSIDKESPKSNLVTKRQRIAIAKARAMKTSIVTITNKDNRENDVMTSVYLSFENQYFGLSKQVPLDLPVELENSLIKIAEGVRITLHKDEVRDGRRTGNKIPTSVKKFAISYARQ